MMKRMFGGMLDWVAAEVVNPIKTEQKKEQIKPLVALIASEDGRVS